MPNIKGMTPESTDDVSSTLHEPWNDVETRLILDELRSLARMHMRRERANHTLQPTALVNEAYARLLTSNSVSTQDRAHFFATASRLMRNILVDHARARTASKRGGLQHQVELKDDLLPSRHNALNVLELDEAITRLSQLDPRGARIVELHFFGGLTFSEIATNLSVSEQTVKRDWKMARSWLRGLLSE